MAEKFFTSLVDMQVKSCERYADRTLFGTKKSNSTPYEWMTYKEFGTLVNRLRGALSKLGVTRGEKVAVIANNRVEWAVCAYATYSLGAHYVPMYESQLPKDWEYILNDSTSVVLFVANEKIWEQTKDFVGKIPSLRAVYSFEAPAGAAHSYEALVASGADNPVDPVYPDPQETAGLIYTSGTTGKPKGVILSHDNIVSNINAVHNLLPMRAEDRSLSFLPWAHSFGQVVELHVLLSMGASMGIAQRVETLIDNLAEVKPTLLFAVPRIFNRIYDGVQKNVASGSPVKRALFNKGLDVAARRRKLADEGKQSAWLDAQYGFFDKLVFSKVRARFGGRLQYAFSGGAALPKEVGEFVDDIGIQVYEGYGLTETSPIATANFPGNRKIGSVGKAIEGVTIYICDEQGKPLPIDTDGEVVVVGPNVMQGYHNHPESTAEVIFDLNGKRAFKTGDMGRIDAQGFVKITGRFKEQYKLENGKYVVPTPLEDQLKLSGMINQAFLYGDNRLYNIVLIVPDFDAVKKWAAENGVSASTPEALANDPKVHARIGEEIEKHSGEFKGYEKPRKWALLTEDFTVENDLLTPKMSVRRRNVLNRYKDVIESLYRD